MKRAMYLHWLMLSLMVIPITSQAQEKEEEKKKGDAGKLTIDRIFNSSEFRGESLGSVRWLEKTGGYTVLESSKENKGTQDIIKYDPKTGKGEVWVSGTLVRESHEDAPLSIANYKFSPSEALVLIFTNTKRVWRTHTRGDYYVFDVAARSLQKLGGKKAKPSSLMFAKFSPDGTKVAYVRERNIYVEDLQSKEITQLTETANEDIINGTFDWVYEEELGLQDGFRWSPDSEHIAYWQMDTSGVEVFNMINTTDGLYPKLYPFKYPKVGGKNSASRIGVTRSTGESTTHWLSFPGNSREHYLARMTWMNNNHLLIQRLNRIQNTNTVYKIQIDGNDLITRNNASPIHFDAIKTDTTADGQKSVLFVEKDPAWLMVGDDHLTWMKSQNAFLWLSERDGWRHLYKVSKDGKEVSLVTPGKFDVFDDMIHVDEKSEQVYFYASPENATQKYLYRAKLDGSSVERVTPKDVSGWNSYNISPDSQYAIYTHSSFDTPSTISLIELPSHKEMRVLKENKKLHEKVTELNRGKLEFFQVDIGEGVKLDGWSMKPAEFEEGKKYPLLFYVYGEPAGQTVLDRWSGNRYLWHLLLTQKGYAVMSVDNRGTPGPRGRAWRKFVYRQIGILAAQDQAAAARALLKKHSWLDKERVGIWGWSGGGSMSLHAIFRYPDIYKLAMSIAPVTNERYYDTIYQERYMGLPQDNVKGYKMGSPITYAKNLKGKLLLIHGTADDNVHYQNSEALVNELIRHNKQFDMFAYPNRTHSIREGKNTRRHLFSMLTRYLTTHLPVK